MFLFLIYSIDRAIRVDLNGLISGVVGASIFCLAAMEKAERKPKYYKPLRIVVIAIGLTFGIVGVILFAHTIIQDLTRILP